ncbi:HAD hydrolase-like protein [Streptomyces sp. NPDC051554]|uniref:HAD hydrolase-like protein n=1 Tax=Streptomyces sp. NPDC051554 TaxID=3365656 RepID=UPI00378EC847
MRARYRTAHQAATGFPSGTRLPWGRPRLDRAGSPERVWMVGDNPVADVAGAQALGIPGILVTPGRDDGLRPAVRRILEERGLPDISPEGL